VAGAFDIEYDADGHSSFVEKSAILPVDDSWAVRVIEEE